MSFSTVPWEVGPWRTSTTSRSATVSPAWSRRTARRPVHVADEAEYERRPRETLDEEVREYREAGDVEELADVFEVVHALRELAEVAGGRASREPRKRSGERGPGSGSYWRPWSETDRRNPFSA